MAASNTEAQKRAERLARALRANLGRRKTQARGRDVAAPEEASQTPESDTEKPQQKSE